MDKKSNVTKVFVAASSLLDQMTKHGLISPSDATSEALGYPTKISYQDYKNRFIRQDIANRVVKSPVQATWKDAPKIYESTDKETRFEKELENIIKDTNLYKYAARADLLAMLGRFSLIYIGFFDDSDPSTEIVKANKISYLEAIPEDRVNILSFDQNPKSPRFSLPEKYQITLTRNDLQTGFYNEDRIVHWSRIIHIAERTIDNDIYGSPFLEPIYNRLIGLEKLAGGSPEMYWRGARPGVTAQAKDNSVITKDQLSMLQDQLSQFVNSMQRWIYVEGMDISSLAPQVVSPKEHVEVQMKLISSATRIPMRILTGSERGQLASTQDERAWLGYVDERRSEIGASLIIRPLVNRLIELGAIFPPKDLEYFIEWESLLILSDKERSEILANNTKALSMYTNSIGGMEIYPPEVFLKDMGKTDAEIELITDITKEAVTEDEKIF